MTGTEYLWVPLASTRPGVDFFLSLSRPLLSSDYFVTPRLFPYHCYKTPFRKEVNLKFYEKKKKPIEAPILPKLTNKDESPQCCGAADWSSCCWGRTLVIPAGRVAGTGEFKASLGYKRSCLGTKTEQVAHRTQEVERAHQSTTRNSTLSRKEPRSPARAPVSPGSGQPSGAPKSRPTAPPTHPAPRSEESAIFPPSTRRAAFRCSTR